MVLFIGTEAAAYYVPSVMEGYQFEFTGTISKVALVGDLIYSNAYEKVLVDLTQFLDNPDVIADAFEEYQKVINSKIIFFAKGMTEESAVVSMLIEKGFTFFVTSALTGPAKDQFRNCLEGKPTYTISGRRVSQTKELSATMSLKKQRSIAVCGCSHRIGATTQALLICKYLLAKGQKVCLVSVNDDMKEWKDALGIHTSRDDEIYSRMIIEGVEIYTDPSKIALIQAKQYDFIVYDFGEINEIEFSSAQFMEKDFCIIVGGVKPGEYKYLKKAYERLISTKTYFVFSFVSEETKPSVLALQGEFAYRTRFAKYSPDPFVYTLEIDETYDGIFPLKKDDEKEKKKHWLFRR